MEIIKPETNQLRNQISYSYTFLSTVHQGVLSYALPIVFLQDLFIWLPWILVAAYKIFLAVPGGTQTEVFRERERVKSLSCVRLFVTLWTVAHQAPPSMGLSRQEYWSGLPFPSPEDLSGPGTEVGSPTLQADSLPSQPLGVQRRMKS